MVPCTFPLALPATQREKEEGKKKTNREIEERKEAFQTMRQASKQVTVIIPRCRRKSDDRGAIGETNIASPPYCIPFHSPFHTKQQRSACALHHALLNLETPSFAEHRNFKNLLAFPSVIRLGLISFWFWFCRAGRTASSEAGAFTKMKSQTNKRDRTPFCTESIKEIRPPPSSLT